MQFADLNWMDVESYLEQDDRVVVITGACEQHSHLSLLTDIRAPLAIAEAACQQEHVLIAPPLPFGISPYFAAYPGTISISEQLFTSAVGEVIGELARQGFRRVLVSNGHGGNTATLRPLLSALQETHRDTRLRLFEWWRLPAIAEIGAKHGLVPNHANWLENFPFTRVGDVPEGEKETPAIPGGASPEEHRRILRDGSFGGAFQAPDDVVDAVFDACVRRMVELLHAL